MRKIGVMRQVYSYQNKKHANTYFQNAWYKYGESNFQYEIIEYCSKEELSEREIYWIKELNTQIPNGYNITPGGDGGGSMIGHHHSEVSKKKMSVAKKGKEVSDITKQKISKSLLGRYVSEETKKKMSIAQKGKKVSDDARQKISIARTGKTASLETKLKMSASRSGKNNCNYGKKFSKETISKLSKSQIGKKRINSTSIYHGVCKIEYKSGNRYRARINSHIDIGTYATEILAAEAYDLAALEYYGIDTVINFPEKLNSYLKILKDKK